MAQKTYRLDFKSSFIESVDEEIEYWQQVSPDKAKELLNSLLKMVDSIEKMPFMYPECEQLPTKAKVYRAAVLNPQYKIIYKVRGGVIAYLSFFNTKRNPGSIKFLRQK
jgi:Txe/YoeB family toxin of Txe-Axe toxin-antitoxin module